MIETIMGIYESLPLGQELSVPRPIDSRIPLWKGEYYYPTNR